MNNQEVFANYGTEKWVMEQNLCFLLQTYWEAVRGRTGEGRNLSSEMPLNPVGFVKEFMKEETLVETEYAEQSKMDHLEKGEVIDVEPGNVIDVEPEDVKEVPETDHKPVNPNTMASLLGRALTIDDL